MDGLLGWVDRRRTGRIEGHGRMAWKVLLRTHWRSRGVLSHRWYFPRGFRHVALPSSSLLV